MRFLFVCLLVIKAISGQTIYDYTGELCTYHVDEVNVTFNGYPMVMQKGEYTLYLNLCQPLGNVAGCDPKARACVLKSKKQYIPNAGDNFIANDDGLVSTNGNTCGSGQFRVNIELLRSNSAKDALQNVDDCEASVRLIDPNFEPKCTFRTFDKQLIDLRALKTLKTVYVNDSGQSYAINLCSPSPPCKSSSINACILSDNNRPISDTSNIKIKYSPFDNEVRVVGQFSAPNKRHKEKTEVLLKCNWFVDSANPIKKLKNYSFELDSKYGCVKMPLNCTFVDHENYIYDLNGLSREDGWVMNGLDYGRTLLNVCGPLRSKLKQCDDLHSQICFKQQQSSNWASFGSTFLPLEEDDEGLRLQVLHGSICPENKSELIRTNIYFRCSRDEKGPKFDHKSKCIYYIVWETPKACPVDVIDIRKTYVTPHVDPDKIDCRVHAYNGYFDLNPLVLKGVNHIHKDADQVEYIISICRPIVIDKNTFQCYNQGGCIVNTTDPNLKTKFTRFGGDTLPVFTGSKISITYTGGICNLSTPYKMHIEFKCSQRDFGPVPIRKLPCLFEFQWLTPHVCHKTTVHQQRSIGCILKDSKGVGKFKLGGSASTDFIIIKYEQRYIFSLCSPNYTTLPINGSEGKSYKSSEKKLLFDDCDYFVEYNMKTEECETQGFNKIRVKLMCNNRRSEDFVQDIKFKGCTVEMEYWMKKACAHLDNETQTCVKKVIDNRISFNDISNCTINLGNGNTLNLKQMRSFALLSKNRTVYSFGIGKYCLGFMCRDNHTVVDLIDQYCPNNQYDYTQGVVKSVFLGHKCSNNDTFKAEVEFKCKENKFDKEQITGESACGVSMSVPLEAICGMQSLKQESVPTSFSTTGLTVGLFLCCGVVFMIIAVWWRKNERCKIYKDRVPIYERNTML